MTKFPAADLRLVRRLEREYARATTREERADDLATAQRLAAHSDRVSRRLAAARDGITIEPPRTRRNLARGAFAALAAIGRVIERALRRADALRRATLAAAVKRTARKALRLARLALRRTVTAIVALVVSSPALALAHPGHAGHDAPDLNAGGVVVLVGVTLGLAAHAWANWGPRRRLVAAVDSGEMPAAGGPSPEPEPEATPEPEPDSSEPRDITHAEFEALMSDPSARSVGSDEGGVSYRVGDDLVAELLGVGDGTRYVIHPGFYR